MNLAGVALICSFFTVRFGRGIYGIFLRADDATLTIQNCGMSSLKMYKP